MKIVPNKKWFEINRIKLLEWIYVDYMAGNIVCTAVYNEDGTFDRFSMQQPPAKYVKLIPQKIKLDEDYSE